MRDNLIWSGNAFFASAGDHMYETKSNTKGSNKPETANKASANKPGTSTKPAAPNKPEKPEKPVKPVKPDNKPEWPAKPVKPDNKPEWPNQPEKPAKPVKPETPVKPENKPEMTEKPAKSEPLSKPGMKGTVSVVEENDSGCGYKTGDLPECAPLAVGYVPWQRSVEPVYGNDDALTRGTLFPGLDLPFMNVANKDNPYAGTPLGDLMAVSFVAHELVLYLDTHPKDTEAFVLLKKVLKLKAETHASYTKKYGPICTNDLLEDDKFTWTHGPWPWETPAPGAK